MSRTLLEVPPGVQCFFGDEARLRRRVERMVVEVFRGWSYAEIVLPLFDFDEVFTRGGGPTKGRSIYRFVGRDGDVMALRPDFTALVAKVVASRLAGYELPLRLFYSGEVLRYQPPRAGQREELFQVGLEHFGDGLASDVEVLLVAHEALSRLGVEAVVITLGHVGIALGLLEEVSASEEEQNASLEAMRRHDGAALKSILGAARAERLIELNGLSGGLPVLEEAMRFVENEPSRRALSRLESVAKTLKELDLGDAFRLDLGEVRGFDYYTGLVFEIHSPGAGRELGGGGRYDSLVGRFGRELPAVGFYLSLDRISELLVNREFALEDERATSVSSARRALEARRDGKRIRLRTR